ncbi:MAG: hypothetical protein IMY82_01805 [Chloroflexi bacterium]|nr:hypothetical protein [Chloroflexota bacterium]
MKKVLLAILLLLLIPSVGWVKNYSCRDSKGQWHFADNLQGLPEECLGQEKEIKLQSDKLIIVPAAPDPQKPGGKFQDSVRAAEREQQEKESAARELKLQAESLVERHRQAVQLKRQAKRRWSYESRTTIKQADDELQQVEKERRQLLDELNSARLTTAERRQIRDLLEGIAAQ